MFIVYKELHFVPIEDHLDMYMNGEMIGYCRISPLMTVEDVMEVIKEQLES